jgi:hypothetical protein
MATKLEPRCVNCGHLWRWHHGPWSYSLLHPDEPGRAEPGPCTRCNCRYWKTSASPKTDA